MEFNTINIGARKLQYNNGAHFINVPNMAVKLLNIRAGDVMQWDLIDGTLQLSITP